MRKQVQQDGNGNGKAQIQPDEFADEQPYFVLPALPDNIAYHGAGSGGKGPGYRSEQSEYISHGIGNRQGHFTMTVDGQKEKLPAHNTDGVLEDQRSRHIENRLQIGLVPTEMFKQLKSFSDSFIVDDQENDYHPGKFGDDGSDGRSVETHCRKAKLSEDQGIVKKYIANGFGQGAGHQVLALIGAYQQRVPHLVDVQEGKSPDPDLQKPYCPLQPVLIGDKQAEYGRYQPIGENDPYQGHQQRNEHALVEKLSDLLRAVFSGSAGNQGLQPIVQSKSDRCENEIINTCNTSQRQGLTIVRIMPQEDIVGDEIDLRNENGKADRQRHSDDLPIADFNLKPCINTSTTHKSWQTYSFLTENPSFAGQRPAISPVHSVTEIYSNIAAVMLKPAFEISIHQEQLHQLQEATLMLEICEKQLTCMWVDLAAKELLQLKQFHLSSQPDETVTMLLEELIARPEMGLQQVRETLVVYNFPEAVLVPAGLFQPDTARPLNELVHGSAHKGLLLHERIRNQDIQNIYRVPRELHSLVQKNFSTGKYWHAYSLIGSRQPPGTQPSSFQLKILVYSDQFVLIGFREGALKLIQTYHYQVPEDVTYYLLGICREFSVDPAEVELTIGGLIDSESALINEIGRYFQTPQWLEAGMTIGQDQENSYPAHYFSPLAEMALCV